jgi:copper homeostasis protein
MLLELCAYNIASCIIAEQAGAGRIELCADPTAGGTTPSAGLIAYCIEHISIPIYPMIRTRGGDFVYDSYELDIMKRDILYCKEAGCTGIATGVQLPDKRIDTENLKRIVEWAYPMEVTCHKVFDRVPDPYAALEDVIGTGCSRILTSALQKTAIEGLELLKELIAQASGRILIMPGGGVRSSNIAQLVQGTGVKEYHSSGILPGDTSYTASEVEVQKMVAQLTL